MLLSRILVLLQNTSFGGQVKKHGKQANISEFRAQLDALGVKIIQVTADGNCFFRALADQLEGNEEEHGKYRLMVVQYIMKHRETFEPFIEDDVPFDEYCKSMEKDGSWAGHMELQASSLVTRSNICIHRIMSPRWYIRNFDNHGARMIHLSYHNEEHYNSVRLKEDPCTGPAKPIVIKADADLSAASHQVKVVGTKSKGESCKNITDAGSIKLVMVGSGCENAKKVEQVLQQLDGDVDAAIEFLVAEQGIDEDLVENDKLPCQTDTSYGNGRSPPIIVQYSEVERLSRTKSAQSASVEMVGSGQVSWLDNGLGGHNENGDCERPNEDPQDTCKHDPFSDDVKSTHDDNSSSRPDDKEIPRNKVCPCGSRKKYKACCGSVTGRSPTVFVMENILAFSLIDHCEDKKDQSVIGILNGHVKVYDGVFHVELPFLGYLTPALTA
ncbi:hypothetical protein HHK36_008378 [Tetracentron sinense]|uniref:OTU domain-containing protein n=1 Tax=Tetracentron sinense TaxID=13715 RepID=A0A835DJ99_TETSI|nr:hypothetical protein HHK36_008378 [Tetracentron sinense]